MAVTTLTLRWVAGLSLLAAVASATGGEAPASKTPAVGEAPVLAGAPAAAEASTTARAADATADVAAEALEGCYQGCGASDHACRENCQKASGRDCRPGVCERVYDKCMGGCTRSGLMEICQFACRTALAGCRRGCP
mmetsp:Transcript_60352/g.153059  ORF Transcript_60352/g.153059 Transcript_60352/m.153059 type:complete len:137 (+) Transcript_60352:93-503(+)